MQNSQHKPPIDWTLEPSKPTFRLFIVCEDQGALFQARKVEDQVRALCGDEVIISRVFWSFPLLRYDQLRQHAGAEAAEADMIVLSFGENNDLSDHVRSLLESLPVRNGSGQAAIVTLLGPNTEPGVETKNHLPWLREIASKRGFDFFCNQDGWDLLDFSKPSPSHPTPKNIISDHISFMSATQQNKN